MPYQSDFNDLSVMLSGYPLTLLSPSETLSVVFGLGEPVFLLRRVE
jgi:hypothetical protein